MVYRLNVIFGWSNVAIISFSFYLLLTELNWCYVHFYELSIIHRTGKFSEIQIRVSSTSLSFFFALSNGADSFSLAIDNTLYIS